MIEPVLVTGAAGFVGRHVTALLRSRGVRVVAHARRAGPGIDWMVDLADPNAMPDPLPANIAAVVHCAAAIPARSGAFDRDNAAASAMFAQRLMAVTSLKRVVHLSSVSVYRSPAAGRWSISEDAATIESGDTGAAYGASMLAAEQNFDALRQTRADVPVTHLRPSSIYGPAMVRNTLLPVLVACALQNKPLLLRGPRPYLQNFIHVADVADIVLTLLRADDGPNIVNAFSDDTLERAALASLICRTLGSASAIVDETHLGVGPEPVFLNHAAKRLLPTFRSLTDHLRDAG